MEMLIFSNRELESRAGAAFFNPASTACPPRLALATLEHTPQATARHWKVSQIDSRVDVDDTDSMRALLPMFQESRPLLLYLHGYNSTPAACFERCDRLQSLYGLEIVRFSWSSKKHRLGDGDPPDFLPRCGEMRYLPSNSPLWQFEPAAAAAEVDGLTCSWWLVMALTGSSAPH